MATVVNFGIYLLESIFILGLIGSAVVFLLTGVEDAEMLAGTDKPRQD